MNLYGKRIRAVSFIILLYVLFTSACQHSDNVNYSNESPRPAFHVKSDEGVVYYEETGNVSEWKDISGSRRDLRVPTFSSFYNAKRSIDEKGRIRIYDGFMETYGRDDADSSLSESGFEGFSMTMTESFFRPDIFIVSAKPAKDGFYLYGFFGNTDVGQLHIYDLTSGVEVNSHTRLKNESRKEQPDVLNVSLQSDRYVYVSKNGVLLDNFMFSSESIGRYIALLNKNLHVYEVIIFQNLTDSQRKKITDDLMAKYEIKSDIP